VCLVQLPVLRRHHALRKIKLHRERLRYELRKEGAAKEWAAHSRQVVGPKETRERSHEGLDPAGLDEQRIEVQPESAMKARFETEVAAPSSD
jgi:hypothetical protein